MCQRQLYRNGRESQSFAQRRACSGRQTEQAVFLPRVRPELVEMCKAARIQRHQHTRARRGARCEWPEREQLPKKAHAGRLVRRDRSIKHACISAHAEQRRRLLRARATRGILGAHRQQQKDCREDGGPQGLPGQEERESAERDHAARDCRRGTTTFE